MKAIAVVFWAVVAVIVLSFGMSVATAVSKHRAIEKESASQPAIPMPAIPQGQ